MKDLRRNLRALFLRHEWLRGYALLSPTLLVMICALALPIIALVVYSFWTQDYITIDKTFTLFNYETFFDKWIYGKLLLRSIGMSATVTLITIQLAYPVAYFLALRVRKNIMTWLILINLTTLDLAWAERFTTGPFPIANNGDNIKVTAVFTQD